jgi:hypothetical protein
MNMSEFTELLDIKNIKYKIIDGKITVLSYADLEGCTSLVSIPENTVFNGAAYFNGCTSLVSIPENTVFHGDAYFGALSFCIKCNATTITTGCTEFTYEKFMELCESDYDKEYKLEFQFLHRVVGKMLEDKVVMNTVNLINLILKGE